MIRSNTGQSSGWKRLGASGAFGLVLAIAGCSRNDAALARAEGGTLASYADSTLTAGVGWGDLRLGQTTLGEIAQRFGKGNANLVGMSEVDYMLDYEDGQVSFLFRIDPSCCARPPALDPQSGVTDLWDWMQTTPCLREQKVASISVCARGSKTFFRGASDKGTRLLAAAPAEVAHGQPGPHPPYTLAGEMFGSPGQQLCFPSGISFFTQGAQATGATGAGIQRITIYAPGR
jgi:hypothetical protein